MSSDLGLVALRLDVTGARSIAEVQQRLRYLCRNVNKDAPWIIGFGWNQELWAERPISDCRRSGHGREPIGRYCLNAVDGQRNRDQ